MCIKNENSIQNSVNDKPDNPHKMPLLEDSLCKHLISRISDSNDNFDLYSFKLTSLLQN